MSTVVRFSQLELDLIDLIPFDQKSNENGRPGINTSELSTLYFGKNPPMNARPIIIGRLRGIAKKAEVAGLDWRLRKTYRSGPIPQSFWRETK